MLTGPDARWITGQNVRVNGGLIWRLPGRAGECRCPRRIARAPAPIHPASLVRSDPPSHGAKERNIREAFHFELD